MSDYINEIGSQGVQEIPQPSEVIENTPASLPEPLENTPPLVSQSPESLSEGYAAKIGTDNLPANVSSITQANAESAAAKPPPDTVYDGLFVGANGQTLGAETPLNQIPSVKPNNGKVATETVIFVNGINTTKDSQAATLQKIANQEGLNVIGIHNATEGMVKDIGQSVKDKLDVGTNPAVDTLANTVYNEIKAGRDVHLLAHSQGGLITSRALTDVYQRLRAEDGLSKADAQKMLGKVNVETFGAAAGHYPDGPKYVHYINSNDPVPNLFGLGSKIDKYNPTLDPGKGAVVHHFKQGHWWSISGTHSFDSVYLPRRVPFEQARRGDFSR